MFSAIRIGLILVVIAGAGGGFMYVKNLQKNLHNVKPNNAKLEQSVESPKAVITPNESPILKHRQR